MATFVILRHHCKGCWIALTVTKWHRVRHHPLEFLLSGSARCHFEFWRALCYIFLIEIFNFDFRKWKIKTSKVKFWSSKVKTLKFENFTGIFLKWQTLALNRRNFNTNLTNCLQQFLIKDNNLQAACKLLFSIKYR